MVFGRPGIKYYGMFRKKEIRHGEILYLHVVICIHYVEVCLLTAHVDDTDLERVGRGIKEGIDLEKLYQKNNRDTFRKKLFI